MKSICTVLMIASSMFPMPAGAAPTLDIGVKGGPDAATLAHGDRDNRYGFTGGLAGVLRHPLGDRFSWGEQLELLYTQRGAETVVDGVTQGESREHYLDLALALHPEVRFGSLTVFGLLGGGLSLLMSANKDNILGSKEDITDGLRRIDVAVIGGVGVAVRLPDQQVGAFQLGWLSLEVRHDIGLVDTDAMNGGFKNRTSSILLGVSFVIARSTRGSPTAE